MRSAQCRWLGGHLRRIVGRAARRIARHQLLGPHGIYSFNYVSEGLPRTYECKRWAGWPPRSPLVQTLEAVVHGADIVDNLFHVFGGIVVRRVGLEGQHVFQRALRAFNLG